MKKEIIGTVCMMCVAVCSCNKEGLQGNGTASIIRPVISSSSIQTKSGYEPNEDRRLMGYIDFDTVGGDTLCLAVYEYDNNELPKDISDQMSQTKGRVLTDANIDKFIMKAWLESENRYDGSQTGVYESGDETNFNIINGATASRSGSDWILSDGPYYWRNLVPTNFWCMCPSSLDSNQGTISVDWPASNASDSEQKLLTFDYTLPVPTGTSPYNDAVGQQDICFAYSRKRYDTNSTNTVSINFNHALSAVYFNVSDVLSSIKVNKIGFINVPSTAHCAVCGNPVAGSGSNDSGRVTFSWSGQTALKNYKQEFQDTDFDASRIQKFNESSKVFMMIPDTLGTNTELWAEFEVKGTTVPKSVNISKFSNGDPVVWKPGKKYLYKLAFKGMENFTFYFNESGNPVVATRSFSNTTTSASVKVPVVSAAVDANNAVVSDVDWYIKEVIRDGVTTPVIGTSFDSSVGGGFSATRNGNELIVEAASRSLVGKGSHEYWVNSMHRTDDLGWSPADWSGRGIIDLSKYDFQTENTNAPMITANCYVIRHAGTYRFPLVYGNAIDCSKFPADGKNVEAYNPTMAAGGSYFLANFKNHLDEDISSPYLPHAGSCAILWQDEADLIHDAHLVTGVDDLQYVEFSISQSEICQNNALVAVKDAAGKVMWSWHIWITNDPVLLNSAIPVKNYTNVIYNFFPLNNLGWIDAFGYPERNEVQVVLVQKRNGATSNTITLTVRQPAVPGQSSGCYYQFGRKDPMCRVDNPAANGGTGTFTRNATGKVTLGKAIQSPDSFFNYGSGSPYDWCSQTYYNLWTGKFSKSGNFDYNSDMIKTVFDPSPRGYKMPASKVFSGFTANGSNTSTRSNFNVVGDFDKGWNFMTGVDDNTVFFPASGYRFNSNGAVSNVGSFGHCWSAVPNGTHYGYSLSFHSGNVSPLNFSYRSYGFSARPVQE